jgi:hypothetical protein
MTEPLKIPVHSTSSYAAGCVEITPGQALRLQEMANEHRCYLNRMRFASEVCHSGSAQDNLAIAIEALRHIAGLSGMNSDFDRAEAAKHRAMRTLEKIMGVQTRMAGGISAGGACSNCRGWGFPTWPGCPVCGRSSVGPTTGA